MAGKKKKERKTGYDRPVTENEEGVLLWNAGGQEFRYYEGRMGINLAVVVEGEEYPCSYAKNLAEAGYFAEGFSAGWDAKNRLEKMKAAKAAQQEKPS